MHSSCGTILWAPRWTAHLRCASPATLGRRQVLVAATTHCPQLPAKPCASQTRPLMCVLTLLAKVRIPLKSRAGALSFVRESRGLAVP